MLKKNAKKIIGAVILGVSTAAVIFFARGYGEKLAPSLEKAVSGRWRSFNSIVYAADMSTSVNVTTSYCGNGIIEIGEVCDDGANNGLYGYCRSDCQGLGDHCGDGIIQPAHEQCDDGVNNGVPGDTCDGSCHTISGGGGGTGVTWGAVVFQGWAYPAATVSLLQDGQVVATVPAGPNGYFDLHLTNITPGSYNFALSGEDLSGNHSTSQTYPITLAAGSTYYQTDALLPPTASEDKTEVKQGNIITVSGQAVPLGEVTVYIKGVTSSFSSSFTTTADALGNWTYAFNTTGTPTGDYYFQEQVVYQNTASPLTTRLNFTIGAQDVVLTCWRRADLNCDGYVDLIDYSIAAYWWKRELTPLAIIKVDDKLYPDGVVNLRDFSVMAYYWTGSPGRNMAADYNVVTPGV